MPVLRRAVRILMGAILFAAPAGAKESVETLALTLQQFSNMALQNSLRSRTAEENLMSNRFGWLSSRRSLTWPTLSAAASERKTFSDTDTGTETETRSRSGSLSLSQPLLTGTSLSLQSAWSRSLSESDTLGIVTPSLTKYSPVYTASFSQPLFIFTGNSSLRSKREADLRWSNNQDGYWRERLSIEFDARVLYYDLLLQSETMDVERRKFESSKLVNETTRALVRAGKLAEVEMVRADIRSRRDQRQIQNAESNLEKAMNRAKDLISLPSDQNISLQSKLTYEPFTIPLEKLLKAAEDNNPDLKASRRNIELTEISLKRTREADNPALTTTGSYDLTQNRSDDAAPLDPYGWSVAVGISWPLFDGTQTRLRTKQGEISLQNAKRSYENQLRDLSVTVQNAYLEIKRAEEQIVDFAPQKAAAERNVTAIRLQYRNGLTRLTDVFDAENQLRELDLEYLSLLVAFNTARDRLKVLIGAGIEDLMPRAAPKPAPRRKK